MTQDDAKPKSLRDWWHRRTTRWGLFWALLIFGAPALSGLLGRLVKSSAWLNDWNAFACAAANAASGDPLYGAQVHCTDVRAAPFVYAPWTARALAPIVEALGIDGTAFVYALVLIPAMALIGWMGFLRPLSGLMARDRLPFFALLTGSALACGNVGYILHALIALPALFLPRARLLFIVAVALASTIKPPLAVFLVVLLLEDRPVWRRLATGAGGGLLCLGAIAASMLAGDPERGAWLASMDTAVLALWKQSIGFVGWWTYFGLPPATLPMAIGYGAFALTLVAASFVLAERMEGRTRVAFGLGVAALLNPRLMDYDLLLLAPAPLLAIAALGAGRLRDRLWTATFVACAVALVLGIADLTPLGMHLALPAFAVVVVVAAWAARSSHIASAGAQP